MKQIVHLLLALCLFAVSPVTMSLDVPVDLPSLKLSSELSVKQKNLLHMAFDIAKRDGHDFPYLLQGIILQESNAGENRNGLKPTSYYGVGQIKVSAARDVLDRFPSMKIRFGPNLKTDAQIKKRLIEDDIFNLAVASKYLLLMKTYGFKTPRQLALAYNQGPGGAKHLNERTHYYPSKVMFSIRKIHK
jgi:hypothetical protein